MVCSRTCVQFEHRSHVPTSSLNRSQKLPISNLSFAYVFCSCLQCPLFHPLEYHFKSLIMFHKHLMNLLKIKHHIWSQLFFSSFFTSTRTRSFNEVESPFRRGGFPSSVSRWKENGACGYRFLKDTFDHRKKNVLIGHLDYLPWN